MMLRLQQKQIGLRRNKLIDGSHLLVTPPSDGYRDCIYQKMYQSIILQAVCDDKYLFKDIFAKYLVDVIMLMFSLVCHLLIRFTHCPGEIELFDGMTVSLHILGDPAYPLFTGLLKSYIG